MKKHNWKKAALSLLLVLCMSTQMTGIALAENTDMASEETTPVLELVEDDLLAEEPVAAEEAEETEPDYADDDDVRVFIVLENDAVLDAGYSSSNLADNEEAKELSEEIVKEQEAVAEQISNEVLDGEELDVRYNLTLLTNAVSANVKYEDIAGIREVDGVAEVYIVPQYDVCETAEPNTITAGDMVGSYYTWESGYTGAGQRIAVIDTGIDSDHPSFDGKAFDYGLAQTAKEEGITVDTYNLLDAEEIAAVLPNLNAASMDEELKAEDLFLSDKIAYAFNYVDENLDVTHDNDTEGDHGTHVSGIACANLYVPTENGFEEQESGVVGIAPDAQLITMKVFGTNGGAYSDDYMAAIEDALWLKADAVNLSLGSSSAGNSAAGQAYIDDIFAKLQGTDTVVSISAGNSGRWADSSLYGANLSGDVNMDTVGSPGSYTNAFTVASAVNSGFTGYSAAFDGNTKVWYTDASEEAPTIYTMDVTADHSGTDYEYVLMTSYGTAEDFANVDVEGKLVLVSRGSISFAEKHSNASAAGAAGLLVYNNVSGTIGMNLSGTTGDIPCASISLEDANAIISGAKKEENGTYTGTVTIAAKVTTNYNAANGYTMSDFSSVGVPGSLELKPEITAPGGNIYSTLDDGQYGLMSGTSMAAPSVAGMSALVAQYIKENGLAEKTGLSIRTLSQSLLMSTAVPLKQMDEETGSFTDTEYSPRSQGAGLANVEKATTSPSYILVGDVEENDGKVKIELGDDPERDGVYDFRFTIYNMSDEKQYYMFDSSVLTEELVEGRIVGTSLQLDPEVTVSSTQLFYDLNGDRKVDIADAAVFLAYVNGSRECDIIKAHQNEEFDFNQDGLINTADVHDFLAEIERGAYTSEEKVILVEANGSTNVSVTVTLSDEDKAYLDDSFENGMYVDGYIYLKNDIADLSVPFLAFYGNWADSSMYDPFDFLEYMNNGDNWEYPYASSVNAQYQVVFNPTNFLTLSYAGSGAKYYYASNMYLRNGDETYIPDRNAFSSLAGNTIASANYTLIRNASRVITTITNAEDGTVYFEKAEGGKYAEFYSDNAGAWQNVVQSTSLDWMGTDADGNPLPEGTKVNISVTAIPEYYDVYDAASVEGKGLSFTVPMTIDNTKPEVLKLEANQETGALDVTVKDNRYVAAISVYDSDKKTLINTYAVNQEEAGKESIVTIDDLEQVFYIRAYDYAGNVSVYRVNHSGMDDTEVAESITLSQTSLVLVKGSESQLTATVAPITLLDDSVVWTSSDETVATVDADGIVKGIADGTATITVTTNAKDANGQVLTAACEVKVETLDVGLNGLVWDADGEVFWSSFSSGNIAEFEKNSEAQGNRFMSAAMTESGKLIAATYDDSQMSDLYLVDPNNGYSAEPLNQTYWCTDLTYSKETGVLYGTYGSYLQIIDAETGRRIGIIDLEEEGLDGAAIGVAYVGTGVMAGFIFDEVYLVSDSGVLYEFYFFPELPKWFLFEDGETGVNPNGQWYFNSLYYDEEDDYIFWSMYDGGAYTTLYAIKNTYLEETDEYIVTTAELSQSAEDVWPIAGLYRDSDASVSDSAAVERAAAVLEGVTFESTELLQEIPALDVPVIGK